MFIKNNEFLRELNTTEHVIPQIARSRFIDLFYSKWYIKLLLIHFLVSNMSDISDVLGEKNLASRADDDHVTLSRCLAKNANISISYGSEAPITP